MVKLVIATSPERLRRARALQIKLLKLITTARTHFFKFQKRRETSLSYEWLFLHSEYDGFPSEPEELNEMCPLPQKIVIKWTLEDIDECSLAIDEGAIRIVAYPRSPSWSKDEIYRYTKSRIYDFIESSLGRRLKSRSKRHCPTSNDNEVNFYRWEFSQRYPEFWPTTFYLWVKAKYFELINALDTGALKVVALQGEHTPIYAKASRSKALSQSEDLNRPGKQLIQDEKQQPRARTDEPHEGEMHCPRPTEKKAYGTLTDTPLINSSRQDVVDWNTDSPSSSPPTKIPSLQHHMQVSAHRNVQHKNGASELKLGASNKDIEYADLLKLCNNAWIDLEKEHNTNDSKRNFTRATLNIGLVYAIQLKEHVQRINTLEHENDNLKIQNMQLQFNQDRMQQQILNMHEKDEMDISNARLEGEKIAEKNVERIWNSAKERGRVIGVCAVENKYRMEGRSSCFTSPPYVNSLARSSATLSTGKGDNLAPDNIPKKITIMCADESRSHLSKATHSHLPPPSGQTSPIDTIPTVSPGLLPTIADFEAQGLHHQIPVTNASVQIPPTTRGFHRSFLNSFLGPIKGTLNDVLPSHIQNPVKWTRFFTIHLDTQPYIFSSSNLAQTYGQVAHFISQPAATTPRAVQGAIYPTLLRLSQDIDKYYYVGHFVVSSVVTTTNFGQVLNNMSEISETDKHTKHKLIKERYRALGGAAEIAKDMPVDFYTLQYAFFGEEQYKILVAAQDNFDDVKSTNDAIDSLLESHDCNTVGAPALPAQSAISNGPAATRRYPSVSENERLLNSNNLNTTSRPLPLASNIPNAPAAKKRKIPSGLSDLNTISMPLPSKNLRDPAEIKRAYQPSGGKGRLLKPNDHKTGSTPLSITQGGSVAMKRRHQSGDEDECPWESSRWKKNSVAGSMQMSKIRRL